MSKPLVSCTAVFASVPSVASVSKNVCLSVMGSRINESSMLEHVFVVMTHVCVLGASAWPHTFSKETVIAFCSEADIHHLGAKDYIHSQLLKASFCQTEKGMLQMHHSCCLDDQNATGIHCSSGLLASQHQMWKRLCNF